MSFVWQLIETFGGFILLSLGLDWLIATRAAAYYATKDYHYSFTFRRATALLLCVLFLTYSSYVNDPAHPWLGGLMILCLLLVPYFTIMLLDVRAGLVDSYDGGYED